MNRKNLFAIVCFMWLFAACTATYDSPVTPEPNPDPYGLEGVWTWDTDAPLGYVWGNMAYCGGNGAELAATGDALWWGVTSVDMFLYQSVYQTNDGQLHGDESFDAYFVLTANGKIERHAGDGSLISEGYYYFEPIENNEWKVGNLHTTAGTILWPYEINSGGNMPTVFEVLRLADGKMTLCYPDGGAFDALGSWIEASYWYFKKK